MRGTVIGVAVLSVAVLSVAMAFPGAAAAKVKVNEWRYQGNGKHDPAVGVSFDMREKTRTRRTRRTRRELNDFAILSLTLNCSDGRSFRLPVWQHPRRIRYGKPFFEDRFDLSAGASAVPPGSGPDNGPFVYVGAEFKKRKDGTRNFKKIVGEVFMQFVGDDGTCSGEEEWKAKRTTNVPKLRNRGVASGGTR